MSSNLLLTIDTFVLLGTLVFYAAASYRSFSVRRAMATPLYRTRALWTGVVALIGAFYSVTAIVAENFSSPQSFFQGTQPLWEFVFFAVLTIVGSLIVFSWIDSTIGVALDLDFLHRDAVGWKRLRKLAWAVVVIGAFGAGLST